MVKKIVTGAIGAILFLGGCASDGIGINTLSENKVDRYYKQGFITNSKKCIINDRELAVVSGAVVGGAGGAVAGANQNSIKGGLIGAGLGAVVGAVIGKEITAYELILASGDKKYIAYSRVDIPVGTPVEFTVVGNKIKNLNILSKKKEVFKNVIIAERFKLPNGIYRYITTTGLTFYSKKYFPYKNDMVNLKAENDNVISMQLVKRNVLKK